VRLANTGSQVDTPHKLESVWASAWKLLPVRWGHTAEPSNYVVRFVFWPEAGTFFFFACGLICTVPLAEANQAAPCPLCVPLESAKPPTPEALQKHPNSQWPTTLATHPTSRGTSPLNPYQNVCYAFYADVPCHPAHDATGAGKFYSTGFLESSMRQFWSIASELTR